MKDFLILVFGGIYSDFLYHGFTWSVLAGLLGRITLLYIIIFYCLFRPKFDYDEYRFHKLEIEYNDFSQRYEKLFIIMKIILFILFCVLILLYLIYAFDFRFAKVRWRYTLVF